MVLPELSWQFVYARVAWALVLASLVAACWPAGWRMPRRVLAAIAGAALALMALPGDASPAWHLGLAFQYPSGLLLGCCLVKLHARWAGGPGPTLMTPQAAAVVAAAGALLYVDAFGLLSFGFYYAGFSMKAPLAALLLAGACALAAVRGHGRGQACAVLAAILLFSLARLPTGNLADALLDPLLWGWALVALCGWALRRPRAQAGRSKAPRQAAPVPGIARAEPFLPMKE